MEPYNNGSINGINKRPAVSYRCALCLEIADSATDVHAFSVIIARIER